MNGLMQNWPLTIDKILEHAHRLYPTKRVITLQPDGSLHRYTYGDLYQRGQVRQKGAAPMVC